MDKISKETRSRNMKAIKSRDTSIEILLRTKLWNNGIRYRKNYKNLIGKPDIVITKYKIAIFCDSEFWHGKDYSELKFAQTSNKDFWNAKIQRNIQRDKEVTRLLETQGYVVLRFFGDDIIKNTDYCLAVVIQQINQRLTNY